MEMMADLVVDVSKNSGQYHPQKAWPEEYIASGRNIKGKCSTFQGSMKLSLIIGQCFGLNPVLGITEIDTSKLRFSILSWRCLYSIVSIIGQSILVFFCFMKLFKDTNSSVSSNTSIVFYVSNCLITVLFLRIAMKWPRLSQQIAMMEASDPNTDESLPRKCNVACILILSLAVLEHGLSELFDFSAAIDCPNGNTLYKAFVMNRFPYIYTFVSYNDVIGLLTQIVNIQCTFNWNFSDVFVICISLYLTSRLEQVNTRIFSVKGKYISSTFWRAMREDYCRATSLVRKVDEVIGGIIFISFANNLFFICLQLLNTLAEGLDAKPSCHDALDERPFRGYEKAIYLVYSFIFLVARSLAVSLVAAKVHTASKEPAHALYRVSSSAYCIEVERFLDQIHTDNVALSGVQFFNVKRGLVLTTVAGQAKFDADRRKHLVTTAWIETFRNENSIAGTIVTYELVLMQFTGVTPTSPSPT